MHTISVVLGITAAVISLVLLGKWLIDLLPLFLRLPDSSLIDERPTHDRWRTYKRTDAWGSATRKDQADEWIGI